MLPTEPVSRLSESMIRTVHVPAVGTLLNALVSATRAPLSEPLGK